MLTRTTRIFPWFSSIRRQDDMSTLCTCFAYVSPLPEKCETSLKYLHLMWNIHFIWNIPHRIFPNLSHAPTTHHYHYYQCENDAFRARATREATSLLFRSTTTSTPMPMPSPILGGGGVEQVCVPADEGSIPAALLQLRQRAAIHKRRTKHIVRGKTGEKEAKEEGDEVVGQEDVGRGVWGLIG